MNAIANSITVLITLCILSIATTANAEALKVLEHKFQLELVSNGEIVARRTTKRIPNIANASCFSWMIKTDPRDELAMIREVLMLPAEPKSWLGVEDDPYSQTITTKDRKTAITKRFMPLKSGVFGNSWCVSEGDPDGDHIIEVWHEEKLLHTFEFEVFSNNQ